MKRIIIEDFCNSRKLALLEDNKLTKLIIEEKFNQDLVRNIYRGRVHKLVKGMEACFVDIGQGKPAYMKIKKGQKLAVGDIILVQVSKSGKGDKRDSLTREVSLQGRYMVYIPSNDRISYSNKLTKDEVADLKNKIKSLEMGQGPCGLIVRTEAKLAGIDDLKRDFDSLRDQYEELVEEFNSSLKPSLVKRAKGQIESLIENNLDDQLEAIVYPESMDKGEFSSLGDLYVRDLVKSLDRTYLERLIREKNPATFANNGINAKLNAYLSNKVWLKNGSYIVIDKTEAMTVIDVNSGRYTSSANYANTVLDVNMGLADEIGRQILMRDLSGIIIVDFIDMKSDKDREDLISRMNKALDADGKNTKVHGFTRLGLLEISRRRSQDAFESYYYNPESRDYYSANRLVDMIEERVIHSIFHDAISSGKDKPRLTIDMDDSKYRLLLDKKKDVLEMIEDKYGVTLFRVPNT
ncbi:ribonuclease E/G [Peptostreptococcus sp. MV1]|uniref:ribonuclease E/G n=1 Tax=Peptostreptococcus sp. MV1 TaxID=1219626 RepID=UPI00068C4CCE|nr:ribonuclease E/G [Peptostreptococcus sp. MV1]